MSNRMASRKYFSWMCDDDEMYVLYSYAYDKFYIGCEVSVEK